jgi:hypothetical protein
VPPSAKTLARRLVPHPLYRRYRQRKVASLIAGYPPREVTHTYGGHTLRVRLTDPLAEGWYDHDWGELEAVAFLRERGVEGGSTSFLVEVHEALSSYGGRADEIVELFSGFERFVAVEDDEPFLPLEGAPPQGRFFLIALAGPPRSAAS